MATIWKKQINIPCVKDHVEEEAPYFAALVWPINKDRLDGYRSRGVDFAHHDRVISKEAQL